MRRVATWFLLLLLQIGAHASAGVRCEGEWEWARAAFLRIQREWPLRPQDDPLVAYVQRQSEWLALAQRVQSDPERRGMAWHVHVVRNRGVNAFAIGGGYIFVTEGALKLAQNESELAAILAHEIGHQLSGHFCRPPPPDLWDSVVSLFDGTGEKPQGGAHGRSVGSLTQVIDLAKEQEADRQAVRLLLAAGYNPHAMLAVARRLPSSEATAHLHDPRRVAALERLLAGVPPRPSPSSREFQEMKRLLNEQWPSHREMKEKASGAYTFQPGRSASNQGRKW